MNKKTTLASLYSFPGFRARSRLTEHPTDMNGRIITLRRHKKKVFVLAVALLRVDVTIVEYIVYVIAQVAIPASTSNSNIGAYIVRGAKL